MKQTLAILILLVAVVGCKPKSPVVGKWTGNVSSQGQNIAMKFEFKEDGTFTSSAPLMSLTIVSSGTYKYEEGNLTTTTEKIDLQGTPPAGLPMDSMKKAAEQGVGKPQTIPVTFKDDKMTLSMNGMSLELTKEKS